jgi:hypothetical protein
MPGLEVRGTLGVKIMSLGLPANHHPYKIFLITCGMFEVIPGCFSRIPAGNILRIKPNPRTRNPVQRDSQNVPPQAPARH